MNNYIVSVVIPVYNSEKFLSECIDSIVNQSCGFSNVEVILVNDGSKDNSLEICNSYSSKFDNIHIIDQKNSGVSCARNAGIKASNGKYIMLLDSDDKISNNTIKDVCSFFEKNYHEVDIVTYPIYDLKNNQAIKSVRYKQYKKGTNIYNVNESIYLNQSNVNIFFKNDKSNILLFDEKMKLSEDQSFCTNLIMKKERIGFVSTAKYYYRKHGGGVSDLKNNPYYCFDYIIKYNEELLKKYPKSKYVQALVIHTLNWRLNRNVLFPYHFEKEKYNDALNRIKKLISKIDIDVIMNNPRSTINNKYFFIKFSGRDKNTKVKNDTVFCENFQISKLNDFSAQINKIKIKDNYIYIYGTYNTLLLDNKIKICLRRNDNDKNIEVNRKNINSLPYSFDFEEKYLSYFETKIELTELKKFSLHLLFDKKEYNLNFDFSKFASFDFIESNYRVEYDFDKKVFYVNKSNLFNLFVSRMKNTIFAFKKNYKSVVFRFLSLFIYNYKNIWLYNDNYTSVNNAFYQYCYDSKVNDGYKRYFVYFNKSNFNVLSKYIEKKYLVKYGSLKHKLLYLNSSKILTSYNDLDIYCPFKSSINLYRDLARYDLIFLQHGFMHAIFGNMYYKHLNEIDKFVISSKLEYDSLINNYGYSKNDFILSGLSRFDNNKRKNKINTIIFAPTWRSYLIGNQIGFNRGLLKYDFINSNYFKEIYKFLHSDILKEFIYENNLKFIFSLHPNFKKYLDCFDLKNLDYIVSTDNFDYDNCALFITDFSSLQYDFLRLKVPVIYFVPDSKEFNAGLHYYRKLCLDNDLFGILCNSNNQVINEMKKIKNNNFEIDKKYEKNVNNLFVKNKDSKKLIYESIINENIEVI